MRVVLDVNVLISAALKESSVPGRALKRAVSSEHLLVISGPLMEKLAEVLQRPQIASRVSQVERDSFLTLIERLGDSHDVDESIDGFADDAEDDAILGTAVAANADVIVTGDKGLLALHLFRGIPILTASQFLLLLDDVDPS